jgi:hypothetical protein
MNFHSIILERCVKNDFEFYFFYLLYLNLGYYGKFIMFLEIELLSVGYDVKFPFHIEPNLMFWSQTFPNPTSLHPCFVVRLRIAPFFVLMEVIIFFKFNQKLIFLKEKPYRIFPLIFL